MEYIFNVIPKHPETVTAIYVPIIITEEFIKRVERQTCLQIAHFDDNGIELYDNEFGNDVIKIKLGDYIILNSYGDYSFSCSEELFNSLYKRVKYKN